MTLREEVEDRVGRPFEEVRDELTELFGRDWEDVEVVISTSAHKTERSEADVIVELLGKVEAKPPAASRVRKAVIRWIGKPWRERENPWDRHKHRVPQPPSTRTEDASDLDEWAWRPDEDEG